MDKLEFTLLEIDQILDNNSHQQLEIFKKRGPKAAITDFSIILGGYVANNYFVDDTNNDLQYRTGRYWTKTNYDNKYAISILANGIDNDYDVIERISGVRPALPFSNIMSSCFHKKRNKDTNLLEVEYGYYPQQSASTGLQLILESLYQKGELKETGKFYTTDSRKYDEYDQEFKAQLHQEYEYDGKRYVRVKVNSCFDGRGSTFQLSNGESYTNGDYVWRDKQYKNGDYVWIEVQPIKWLVDEKENLAICEKIIVAGVQFNNINHYEGNFEITSIKKFLDEIFSKDLQNSMIRNSTNIENLKSSESKPIHLKPETRNPIVIEANIEHKEGANVTIDLPQTIFQSLQNSETVTLRSVENSEKQLIYRIHKK